MARWHLTSSEVLHRLAGEHSEHAGLVPDGERIEPGAFLRTYHKRAVAGTNVASVGASDWIAVAGTLICDRSLGGAALPAAYAAFARDPEHARDRLLGHYAVAVRLGERVHVLTDEQGSLALYYGTRGRDFVVSNSLQLVATVLGAGDVDPAALLNFVLDWESVGPATIFPGVKRLFGGERLVIDPSAGSLDVVETRQTMACLSPGAQASMPQAVAEYVTAVREVFDELSAVPSVGINTTGGLDTRTVLAAALDRGIAPLLMYGVGNSMLTNTRPEDLEAAVSLARLFGLPFYRMDWSGSQPHSRERLTALFRRHGFPFTTYGSSDGFLRELEGAIEPYPMLQMGGYSPAFTNMKLWERATGEYSIDDIVEHYLGKVDPRAVGPERYGSYRQHVASAIREALERGPVDVPEGALSAQTFVQARLSLYIRPESIAANFFNEFSYYLAPFLTKRLYDPLLTLPLEFRKGDAFQLRVIHALCGRCLEVPVFSGLHAQVLDLEQFTMTRAPVPANVVSAAGHRRRRGLMRRIVDRLPAPFRRLLRSAVPRRLTPAPPRGLPTPAGQPPPGATLDEAIRLDSSRAVREHRLGGLFGDLSLLHLARLHRADLVLFGVDQVMGSASAGPDSPSSRAGSDLLAAADPAGRTPPPRVT